MKAVVEYSDDRGNLLVREHEAPKIQLDGTGGGAIMVLSYDVAGTLIGKAVYTRPVSADADLSVGCACHA